MEMKGNRGMTKALCNEHRYMMGMEEYEMDDMNDAGDEWS